MSAVNFAVRRTSASNLRDMNEYNNLQMRPLNRLSPNEYLASFFSKQSVTNVWQVYNNTVKKVKRHYGGRLNKRAARLRFTVQAPASKKRPQ